MRTDVATLERTDQADAPLPSGEGQPGEARQGEGPQRQRFVSLGLAWPLRGVSFPEKGRGDRERTCQADAPLPSGEGQPGEARQGEGPQRQRFVSRTLAWPLRGLSFPKKGRGDRERTC